MHFFDTKRTFYFGNVEIGDNCFIGINTLICKPVKIVSNCIVEGGVLLLIYQIMYLQVVSLVK
ncbi:DapH/DapD/GlmU-related protein [uncultured Treponema sp.]|uniref:DapH/DapD/GlmU-related protein n=1 Tax=uncultured Treponema sp. TaxID=162155 RepID=UPI00338D8E0E